VDRDGVLELAEEIDAEVAARIRFVYELDRLKDVLRQTLVLDGERRENSAEHSWHVVMTALVMAPFADETIDVDRVLKILLVHDIVEIDAGDVFIYDEAARAAVEGAEQAAADRIFGMIPDPDGAVLRALWDEYEARDTPEARFAYACDRLQPMLMNLGLGGGSWLEHGVDFDRVREINGRIVDGSPRVWGVAEQLLEATIADLESD
jgi:putative hydrolase of HD superfamily